jgi:hypothetical protein
MTPELERYIYPLGAIALALLFFFVLYMYQRRRSQPGAPHSWLSYLLLWPLILDADKDKRDGRFLTKRELLGWGLVVAISVLAIWLTPRKGG